MVKVPYIHYDLRATIKGQHLEFHHAVRCDQDKTAESFGQAGIDIAKRFNVKPTDVKLRVQSKRIRPRSKMGN